MELEARLWRKRLLLGSVFALPVALVGMSSMLPGLGMEWWERGPKVVGGLPYIWLAEAILAAVVQVSVATGIFVLNTRLHAAKVVFESDCVCNSVRPPSLARPHYCSRHSDYTTA